ncbi:MAG: hypothetical protein HYZ50_04230 [Deltaproteobacteria bacterium]|nr:hypothetical protein [Deltaproteobacteria bacterium]
MRSALHVAVKVLPGHKIEISTPELSEGDTVEVFLVLPELPSPARRSALDLLESLPGQRSFKTAEEADRYLQEERDSWER